MTAAPEKHTPKVGERLRGMTDLVVGMAPAAKAGVLGLMGPGAAANSLKGLYRWDFVPAGLLALAAARDPHHTAIIDDGGSQTYEHLNNRTNQLARALRHGNIRPRDKIGVLCRNHRGFIQALCAHGRLGTDIVLLNPSASSKQTLAVIHEQKVDFLFIDEEFTHILPEDFDQCPVAVAWLENYKDTSCVREGWTSMQEMIRTAPPESLPAAKLPTRPRRGRVVILTSGTTGTPKGARRPEPKSWMPASSIMSKIPMRQHRPSLLLAPFFHTWGFANIQLCMALRSTMILRRNFDPKDILQVIQNHNPYMVILVPTMLQRVIDAMPDDLTITDEMAPKIIASSGSAIPEKVVRQSIEKFGPTLYSLYGSTEVSWATIATPDELAENSYTAGGPPLGTRITIRDEDGKPLAQGEHGRIFVGNNMLFEGYTRPGADKNFVEGQVCTGDLGYLDEHGRLFISGREDDMIVSGGENVFPRETEEVLYDMPGVSECAVVGVEDEKFGQALVAYIVRKDDAAGKKIDNDSMRTYVKEHLSRSSVPREAVFLDELPRNGVGKVVPRELPKPWEKEEAKADA